jgi:hypothetical protein
MYFSSRGVEPLVVTSKPANDGRAETSQRTVFGTKFFYPACSPSGKSVLVRKPSNASSGEASKRTLRDK